MVLLHVGTAGAESETEFIRDQHLRQAWGGCSTGQKKLRCDAGRAKPWPISQGLWSGNYPSVLLTFGWNSWPGKVRTAAKSLSICGLGHIINPKRLETTCSTTEMDPVGADSWRLTVDHTPSILEEGSEQHSSASVISMVCVCVWVCVCVCTVTLQLFFILKTYKATFKSSSQSLG